jgi:hypothetical protein
MIVFKKLLTNLFIVKHDEKADQLLMINPAKYL